jgi:L-aminopeptidase/D-esterase-like protein
VEGVHVLPLKNFEFGDTGAGKGMFTEGRKRTSGLCSAVVLRLRCNLARGTEQQPAH